jgi:uncharacterized protein
MKPIQLFFIFIGGLLFGFGLAFSGMTQPEIVLSFLQLKDLGLLLILGIAAGLTLITYQIIKKRINKPIVSNSFDPYPKILRKDALIGAVIFGIGWGISGLCPGSALASIGIGNMPILIGIGGMFLGSYVQGAYFSKK